jgi:hypothetical protein
MNPDAPDVIQSEGTDTEPSQISFSNSKTSTIFNESSTPFSVTSKFHPYFIAI